MKIGINMLLWSMEITPAYLPQMQKIKAAGADGVEFPIMSGDGAGDRELALMLDDLGLERTCVTVFSDPEGNPVSPNREERQKAIDAMRGFIERAHNLGATVLCGPIYQTLGWFSGTGPTEEEKEHAAGVLRTVADDAQAAGVTLAIEPLNRFESYLINTLADAEKFVKRVGHPSVGAMYDTFHGNIEEKDPVGCIRRHGGVLRHFHVSASDRGTPGQDHVDWPGTFAALRDVNYDEWLVLEAFGRAFPGLAAATKIWRDLFESSERAALDTIAFVKEQLAASRGD